MRLQIGAPRSLGTLVVSLGLAALLVATGSRLLSSTLPPEQKLRMRYEELRRLVNSFDQASREKALRPGFAGDRHSTLYVLTKLAHPLTARSTFSSAAKNVQVCPVPMSRYVFLSGGHTVEMVRVDNQWYFSGAFHFDTKADRP